MTSRKYYFLKAFCIGLLLMPLGIWAQKTEVYNQPQRNEHQSAQQKINHQDRVKIIQYTTLVKVIHPYNTQK
jgi:hypothetical protein